MRIMVHDYCGHPFQVQLSRWLARQGHTVCHVFSSDIQSPRGDLTVKETDPQTFSIRNLSQGKEVPKYQLVKRYIQEQKYGQMAADLIKEFRPDVVISGNATIGIQSAMRKAAAYHKAGFIFWLQDLISSPIEKLLVSKFGPLGRLPAAYFKWQEFSVIKASERVVVISDDFVPLLTQNGVAEDRIVVEPNWSPLSDLPMVARKNDWSERHGLDDRFCFLYSGTLGMKHDPSLLSALATDQPDAAVVVVSQGPGRQWLEEQKAETKLDNLVLLDFQDMTDFPNVLGSGDVVMAILEPFAGVMSVPSKVLSYLCAGRPILSCIPPENAAARMITDLKVGLNTPAQSPEAFLAAARHLREDEDLRRRCGEKARSHAETSFDIDNIGARFLAHMQAAAIAACG